MNNKRKKLSWYVLNGDVNAREVKPWNIFNNWLLEEDVQKHIKAYRKGKLDYSQFKEEVRKSIAWQEWGRCEYEIYAAQHPWTEEKYWKKIDCYEQVLPNLDILCRYLIKR